MTLRGGRRPAVVDQDPSVTSACALLTHLGSMIDHAQVASAVVISVSRPAVHCRSVRDVAGARLPGRPLAESGPLRCADHTVHRTPSWQDQSIDGRSCAHPALPVDPAGAVRRSTAPSAPLSAASPARPAARARATDARCRVSIPSGLSATGPATRQQHLSRRGPQRYGALILCAPGPESRARHGWWPASARHPIVRCGYRMARRATAEPAGPRPSGAAASRS